MARREILLESGTNEVEFIEFLLGDQSFGVNVAKIREIITYNPASISAVPDAFHSVMGMFILRDATLPLIDLKKHMGVEEESTSNHQKVVLVCEFNDLINGFLVDGVNQIHRCSWDSIEPLSPFISQFSPSVTSSITIDKKNILLIDLEHIITDIYPATKLIYSEDDDPEHAMNIPKRHHEREHVHIILAEDSPIVRSSVKRITDEVGYTKITVFDNGEDAYRLVESLVEKAKKENRNVMDFLSAVVTDIEMPKMDGLTVCKKIKSDLNLTQMPVIIFSSLINDQMIAKCRSVGADSWANKLKIQDLIHTLDKLCLEPE